MIEHACSGYIYVTAFYDEHQEIHARKPPIPEISSALLSTLLGVQLCIITTC